MGLIEDDWRDDLHVLRRVRNAFAHPRGKSILLSKSLVSKFKGYKVKEGHDHYGFFSKKVDELWAELKSLLPDAELIAALLGEPPKQKPKASKK